MDAHRDNMSDLRSITDGWLRQLEDAVLAADVASVVELFLPNGWLRDILVFSWDSRSLEGHKKIFSYLDKTLHNVQLSGFKLDDAPGYSAELVLGNCIGAGFTFDMPDRRGRGYVRLSAERPSNQWRALSLFMMVDAIKEHEELAPELGTYDKHTLSWQEVHRDRLTRVEANPFVIIMGAGQTGLHMAARFKQLNIPTIVLEKNARVGDQWRERYPTLSLHSISRAHTMLYQPYPKNWPIYTPRDRVADWLEQYAIIQDLVVWRSSYVLPGARYDEEKRRWTVTVCRDNYEVVLHSAHIVSAIGSTGPPRIPTPPGRENFRGTVVHSGAYMGGEPFSKKRAIVVGACQSAADILQDLAFRGAASVTMVQRSSTCVISIDTATTMMEETYPEGLPTEVCDVRYNSMPLGLAKQIARNKEAEARAQESALHAKLRKSGLKLNMGKDGSGWLFLVYERLGGYFLDVGLADYIEACKVKVKQGVEIERFTESSVVFTDGSELPADLVVFATGWRDPRDTLKEIFGAEVIQRTSPCWGLDEECEIQGCCRPTGHPGLWYAGGDFPTSRFFSKRLGLLLKAHQIGML